MERSNELMSIPILDLAAAADNHADFQPYPGLVLSFTPPPLETFGIPESSC